MSTNVKHYTIGGKKYVQQPLVLGQVRQILNVISGLTIPRNTDTLELIAVFGTRLSDALAVLLTPEGVNLRDKDLIELAAILEFEIQLEQAAEVIEDFFTCNPIASLSAKIEAAAGKLNLPTGSRNLSVSSAQEILPAETLSSGDIQATSANLT